ncbi:very short patch repair endonuclease [Parasalinivibrio latis]|uniref:very short patch repair endonuclease n=1 Tax=Parasalinivibrio latis TaxID=2952610 RepID=UPI003DA69EF5
MRTDLSTTSGHRHRNMKAIKSKDTAPERFVRTMLYHKGFRYRLNAVQFPGKPDLWLRKHNAVIFINGCFWHLHNCHLSKIPKSRREFWAPKLVGNRNRDLRNIQQLLDQGYRILVIWECSMKGRLRLPADSVAQLTTSWILSGVRFGAIDHNGLNTNLPRDF